MFVDSIDFRRCLLSYQGYRHCRRWYKHRRRGLPSGSPCCIPKERDRFRQSRDSGSTSWPFRNPSSQAFPARPRPRQGWSPKCTQLNATAINAVVRTASFFSIWIPLTFNNILTKYRKPKMSAAALIRSHLKPAVYSFPILINFNKFFHWCQLLYIDNYLV